MLHGPAARKEIDRFQLDLSQQLALRASEIITSCLISFFETCMKYLLLLLFFLSLSACSDQDEVRRLEQELLVASEQGNQGSVKRVLQHGIDVNTQDLCFFTPLIKSSQHGNLAVVRQLLKAGAMVNLSDKGGYTALMQAAGNNHPEIVETLLKAGADPDRVEDTHGWTALIWAAKQGYDAPVELLLRHGANPGIRDDRQMTAADWAREEGHASMLWLLGQNRADN
jgi:ankyrin repeat protein